MTWAFSSQWSRSTAVPAPLIRILREDDGDGWLVVTARGHGWVHGDRQSAIADKAWLDRNERGRP
jgi:hypothetical protein